MEGQDTRKGKRYSWKGGLGDHNLFRKKELAYISEDKQEPLRISEQINVTILLS